LIYIEIELRSTKVSDAIIGIEERCNAMRSDQIKTFNISAALRLLSFVNSTALSIADIESCLCPSMDRLLFTPLSQSST
jgi:hypothetical protein